MRNQISDRGSARPPKTFRKKKRKRGHSTANNGEVNGNVLAPSQRNGQTQRGMPDQTEGFCQKCGQPAPDGKLCPFHRNLLNSIRNSYR